MLRAFSILLLMLTPASAGDGFFAHKNFTAQTGMPTLAYTRVIFSATRFDIGSKFNTTNSKWTPSAGLVQLNAHVWWTAHASLCCNATFVIKIIKNSTGICNGADVAAGVGTATVGFPTTAVAHLSVVDYASGTDSYELCAYGTSDDGGNDLQLDGNPAHTHFSGAIY